MTAGRDPLDPLFRRLFNAVPVPLLVLDANLIMIAMNDAYLKVSGARREDLLGHTPMAVFPDNPADPAATGVANITRSLQTVLATGRQDTMALQRYDVRATPGGQFVERYWSPVNSPVLDEAGRVAYIIHRVEEVTDFVRLRGAEDVATAELRTRAGRLEADLITRAREVQDANRQLRDVNAEVSAATAALREQQQAKDRFIATLSHELRNPLAAIRAAIDLLALDVPAGHPAIDVIERQVGALVRLTDDLLDSSRALTGRLTLVRRALDLRDVVTSVTGELRAHFDRAQRMLTVTVPDHPAGVHGDRVRLAQLLGNLLSNAFAYTRPGGTVQVALTAADGQAILRVSDDGMGFDPAEAETLFDVFAQGIPSAAAAAGVGPYGAAPGGLGLGLGLVRSIAGLHGGTVSAHSEGRGRGAQFVVRLPLSQPGQLGGPAGPGRLDTARRPMRVLVIEDNEDLAETYRLLLERRGDTVAVAGTGERGLAELRSRPFDLILCDLVLPDVTGYEVARLLRRHPRRDRLRLVAVSGLSQSADRQRSRRAGFDAHLAKPMTLADLDRALAGWSPS